ncbi:MAG TPA: hypothetical protein VNQ76_11325, partial [Planctomicrobium sp.]|nr:hypothetical protein [Planctomicrobium sp.]
DEREQSGYGSPVPAIDRWGCIGDRENKQVAVLFRKFKILNQKFKTNPKHEIQNVHRTQGRFEFQILNLFRIFCFEF